ncbi:MAG: hypothetical protein A2020_02275 [Lentisphaerae bacterium GWF2_45_14]|nr:MAG: hypothetical protein A2020_02275 [Lentisphaerae bacterium GWF2_45_14]
MSKRILLFISVIVLFYSGYATIKSESESSRPAWNQLEDLNIIPCPKVIERHGKDKIILADNKSKPVILIPELSSGKIKIAAGLIADEIERLTGKRPVIADPENASRFGSAKRIELKNTLPGKLNKYPLGQQGYHIEVNDTGAFLSAEGDQGVLYAAGTLNQMLSRQSSGELTVPDVEITDWPDFKNRAAHTINISNYNQGKELVDWLLKYKYNYVMTGNRPENTPEKIWTVLRKVNEYGRDRGVGFMYRGCWSIGDQKKEAANPDFKGCISYKNRLFCWSRDNLIRKTALEYSEFINATQVAIVNFHCLDSKNENWSECCDYCKKRFGNERLLADANVINIFNETIRKNCKDVRLAFVTQPYGIDIGLPGNEEYFEFYKELSRKIPPDVTLNKTGYDSAAHRNINNAVSQPVIRWQNGSAFQAGRFFTTEPRLFKGAYFPERKDDIAFINESYGSFRDGDVMLLTGIEYMWNTEAPGASVWESDKTAQIKLNGIYASRNGKVDGKKVSAPISDGSRLYSGEWNFVLEPPETSEVLLKRICISLYGDTLAPFMYDFCRLGIAGWVNPHKALEFAENESCSDNEYRKCLRAQSILKEAIEKCPSRKEKIIAERFLKRMVPLSEFYKLEADIRRAQEALRNDKSGESMIKNIGNLIHDAKKKMADNKINSETASYWLSVPEGQLKVLEAECQLKTKMRLQNDRKGLKIAIYYPNLKGGKVVGADKIFEILSSDEKFVPVLIDNLEMKELQNYKALIIPHLNEWGKGDDNIYYKNIREYEENGGGVYFEHDSVGFYRAVLKESIFPEICGNAFRRKESHDVIANGNHPCLDGIKKNEKLKHLYWDHLVLMPGPQGTVLLTDSEGDAVAIAGNKGKGRIVFSGMITYPPEKDPSADPAKHIDKDFLINCVNWLAGCESEKEMQAEKEFKVLYDSGEGIMRLDLNSGEKYTTWLSPLFKLQHDKKYLVSFELKKENPCRFIPIINLYGKDGKEGKRLIENFPFKKESKNFQKFSGVFECQPDSEYDSAKIKFSFDWSKNTQTGTHTVEIKNISIYEMPD